jgi:type II secretory pathway component PulK
VSKRKEKGVVLLAVVFIVAVLGILVLQFSYFTRLDSTMAAHFRDREESYALAQAGVSQAISLLEEDKGADQSENEEEPAAEEPAPPRRKNVDSPDEEKGQDDLQEDWAQPARVVKLGNGRFIFKIVDEDRKFNLNQIVVDAVSQVNDAREAQFQAGEEEEGEPRKEEEVNPKTPEKIKDKEAKKDDDEEDEDEEDTKIDKESKEALLSLLDKLDVDSPKDIVKALADWIDADNEGSAEKSYYSTEDPGYPCKNFPLESMGELALIKDIGPELLQGETPREKIRVSSGEGEEDYSEEEDEEHFRGLREYLTVYSDGKVNINTASKEVLETVLGEDLEDLAGDIIRAREEQPFSATKEVPEAIDDDVPSKALDRFKVTSDYFTILSEGQVGKITTRIRAVVQRTEDHIRILSWRVEG